jgi:hypothetical protein
MELHLLIRGNRSNDFSKEKAKTPAMAVFAANRLFFALVSEQGHCPKGQWPLGHSTHVTIGPCPNIRIKGIFLLR